MGYRYSFMDNETYGADDINAAISRFTTAGVCVYPTDENIAQGMNEATAAVAESGVEYFKESLVVTDEAEGYVKINSGTAFFDDGVTMVVDSDGIILEKVPENYVYLYRDIEMNCCRACVQSSLPQTGCVALAYIESDGTLTDKRKYAVSKLAPNTAQNYISHFIDLKVDHTVDDDTCLAVIDIGHPNFSYVGFRNMAWSTCNIDSFGEDGYTSYMPIFGKNPSRIRFKKVGSTIELYVRREKDAQTADDVEIIAF